MPRIGTEDLTPDVNQSGKDFSVVKEGIRFGMAAIKNVGEGAVDIITEARQENGLFTSFFDFCCRMDLQKVNKRVLEGLIKVGAFDSLGDARSQTDGNLGQSLGRSQFGFNDRNRQGKQAFLKILDETSENTGFDQGSFPLPNIPEWPSDQLVKFERELTGFYITAHPLDRHAKGIQRFATSSTATLTDYGDGREVKLCGVVSTVKQLTTKKGDQMAYIQLEDLQGTAEIIGVSSTLLPDVENCWTLNRSFKSPELSIKWRAGLESKLPRFNRYTICKSKRSKQVTLTIDVTRVEPTSLVQIESIFRRYPGPTSVALDFHLPTHLHAQTSGLPKLKITPRHGLFLKKSNKYSERETSRPTITHHTIMGKSVKEYLEF